jgi:hypothetical protein
MITFKIPVSWEEYGVVEIDAETFEDAIRIFDEQSDDLPLPEGDYIDGSFKRENEASCREFNEVVGIL